MKEPLMQAGQLVYFSLIIFQATPAENVWLHAQTYDLLILRSPQLSFASRLLQYVRAGMDLYRWYRLLACKQRVVDAISVKTLVRWSLCLPNLLCRLWIKEKCLITIQHPAKSGNIAVTYTEKWLDIQQLIGWIIYLCEMCTTLPDKLFRLYSAEHETTLLATLMQSYI